MKLVTTVGYLGAKDSNIYDIFEFCSTRNSVCLDVDYLITASIDMMFDWYGPYDVISAECEESEMSQEDEETLTTKLEELLECVKRYFNRTKVFVPENVQVLGIVGYRIILLTEEYI